MLANPEGTLRCRSAIEQRLAAWGAGLERYRDADGPLGARQWRIPTREIGVWVLLNEPDRDRASVTRVDERSSVRVSFDAGCAETSTTVPTTQAGTVDDNAFSDGDLRALLADEPRGVVYVWSPHMPLSVDGYRTVADVALRMGLSFTALRDPMSDARYGASVATEAGLPPAALRPFSSLELTLRQLTLHAPAILVFAQGHIAGLAVPGYREAAGFETVISERLRLISSPGAGFGCRAIASAERSSNECVKEQ